MSPVPSYQTVLLTELPVHGDFLRQLRKKECILIYKEKVVSVQIVLKMFNTKILFYNS